VAMKNGRKQMVLRDAKAVNAHLWPGAITARASFPPTSPELSGSVTVEQIREPGIQSVAFPAAVTIVQHE
jgi:hypothetical protein